MDLWTFIPVIKENAKKRGGGGRTDDGLLKKKKDELKINRISLSLSEDQSPGCYSKIMHKQFFLSLFFACGMSFYIYEDFMKTLFSIFQTFDLAKQLTKATLKSNRKIECMTGQEMR